MTKKVKDMTPEEHQERLEYQRAWCEKNRDKTVAYRNKWIEKNPNYPSEYYQKHKGERTEYFKERYHNDPEAFSTMAKQYRAMKKETDPDFMEKCAETAKQWRADNRKHNREYMREYMKNYRLGKKWKGMPEDSDG